MNNQTIQQNCWAELIATTNQRFNYMVGKEGILKLNGIAIFEPSPYNKILTTSYLVKVKNSTTSKDILEVYTRNSVYTFKVLQGSITDWARDPKDLEELEARVAFAEKTMGMFLL